MASPIPQIAVYQASAGDKSQLSLSNAVLTAFRSTLLDTTLEPSLRAYSLSLPDFSTLAQVSSRMISEDVGGPSDDLG